jgi:hypothetical protein
VIKNYAKFGEDGKVLMGKYVSEKFKEVHGADWKARNPGQQDILTRVCGELRTEARWEKAVQRLRDAGTLESSPRDIGALIRTVQNDVVAEEEERIKATLWNWARPHIARTCAGGLAEWYKKRLAGAAFDQSPVTEAK